MKKNSFIGGAIIATLAIIISKILGVLYVIPFERMIGKSGGALYGYAYNIYNIFLAMSSAGIPLAISKLTSEYKTKNEINKKNEMYRISKNIIYIFSCLSFLICFIFAKQIASFIIQDLTGGNTIEDVCFVIRCVSFALLIVPVLSISRGYLQGHGYISPSSISQVIEQIVRILVILLGTFLALKVFNIELVYAVGISVFAAALGALASYFYLLIKLKKAKCYEKDKIKNISKEDKKEIIKKIITYSVPFIIIAIIGNLYNTLDMVTLIKGLNNINFNAVDIEDISAIFTTWGNKILSIVKAIATGLTVSLIPPLVSAHVSGKNKEANGLFNKAFQILLFIVLPIVIFISIFSTEVWNVFYSVNSNGPLVLKYYIIIALFDSSNILLSMSLQGLYRNKTIYLSITLGLILKMILNIPLIYLFNNLNFYAPYGAICATILSYIITQTICLIILKKKEKFEYNDTLKLLPKLIFSLIIFIILCIGYKKVMFIPNSYILNLIYLGVIGLLSVGTYILINFKQIKTILLEEKK